MTPTVAIAVGVIVIAALNVVLWFLLRRERSGGDERDTRDDVLEELRELRREVDSKLGASAETVRTQLTESSKIASEAQKVQREVVERLTKLDETNRQVISFADQLQHLQDVLQNPKQRGVLGEYYLETVLKNVLPPGRYQMQYGFANGEIVDAVIFLEKDKILPIDSKFSLENYNRILESRDQGEREKLEKAFKADLKNRIDETSKYIRPEENTMDFAFMFIPSEGIYYDLLINQVGAVKTNTRDLIEYAFQQKKVIIVSPTSFLAYLQTVLQGLKSLQIEEQAKEIRKNVIRLVQHLQRQDDSMQKLGKSLDTTVNHYTGAYKQLQMMGKDVKRITGDSPDIEVLTIEKPGEELR